MRDSLLKKFRKSRLQIDKDQYREAQNNVQKLIKSKRRSFYEEQLKENVGKPRELWKSLKSLGLDKKSSADTNISLKNSDGKITSSPEDTAEQFKNFFANLADGLLKLLPKPSNKFGTAAVVRFYQRKLSGQTFCLSQVGEEVIIKALHSLQPSKAPQNL